MSAKWHILYQNPKTARPDGRDLAFHHSGPVELPRQARALFDSLRREIKNERVIAAMERVPRDLFIPTELRHLAYVDEALPIGEDQTISQPFIVAMMTSALDLKGGERVLEIGTGSGYQAAVLSNLAREVVTVERKEKLTEAARQRLRALGCGNVTVHQAGGTLGWPDSAPYDAIIVTAAAPHLPESLVDQLKEGGHIVVPIGGFQEQQLMKVTKTKAGLVYQSLGGCRFVPLIGTEGWSQG